MELYFDKKGNYNEAGFSSSSNLIKSFSKNEKDLFESTLNRLGVPDEEINRFTYSTYHELIAPIKSIQGLLDLIKKSGEYKDSPYLPLVEKSISQLENTIKDIRRCYVNNVAAVRYTFFDLNELILEVIEQDKFDPVRDSITIEIKPSLKTQVYSDRTRLKMIIDSLVCNCYKFCDKNKQVKHAIIDYYNTMEAWGISVFDNGIGINPAYQNKIYDVFFRACDERDGTGLGLYVVQEAIKKLNGNINVNSREGQFTSFAMSFPKIN